MGNISVAVWCVVNRSHSTGLVDFDNLFYKLRLLSVFVKFTPKCNCFCFVYHSLHVVTSYTNNEIYFWVVQVLTACLLLVFFYRQPSVVRRWVNVQGITLTPQTSSPWDIICVIRCWISVILTTPRFYSALRVSVFFK